MTLAQAVRRLSVARVVPTRYQLRRHVTRSAGRIAATAAATGLVFTLTGCWNAPEYLIPPPIPEPEDVVGAWVNPDDDGQIDFRADGTCQLTDIPEGALSLDPPGPDGKPTGRPITADCTWQVEDDRPAIHLGLDALKWGTMIDVRGYDGTEIGFYLGDPDQGDRYVLYKQAVR